MQVPGLQVWNVKVPGRRAQGERHGATSPPDVASGQVGRLRKCPLKILRVPGHRRAPSGNLKGPRRRPFKFRLLLVLWAPRSTGAKVHPLPQKTGPGDGASESTQVTPRPRPRAGPSPFYFPPLSQAGVCSTSHGIEPGRSMYKSRY